MKQHTKTLNLLYMALFVAVMAICSWVSIPSAVPFTLQTFAAFCALCLLGGKRGTIAILVYIALGATAFPYLAAFPAASASCWALRAAISGAFF